ncbi:dihydrolipoamide acetyltransferase family protein [Rhabdochlamydiaceae symbiont of Dictyostelium giganteum]|uniref:dihydrolipoamide acetyltransferase family protein n=1 Tax=Rhabdochlamydiaceae symbiont of Dictyostelium giganteum TaxID=3342349 RepID=UPI00384D6C59
MSEEYLVALPKLGESIVSATVVQWFKKEGDTVYLDEPLLEVSTDKVNSEIPSPTSGILRKITAFPDQEVEVGEELGIIEPSSEKGKDPIEVVEKKVIQEVITPSCAMRESYSPALLRIAREENISLEELSSISATGHQGRLSKRDLELYVEQKRSAIKAPMIKEVEGVEHLKMTGMRKAIADNMVRSFYEAPHASLITEVDVTEILTFIQQEKEAFLKEHGVKLTMTSFVAKAIAQALTEYPLLNSSLDQDTILIKRQINLGIAVSVDQGILVPVIPHVPHLKFSELARCISDLSQRARLNQLQPAEVKEGTITLTNFGISGVLMGIPIIRYPEVAIIGMGAIHKKVAVLDDNTFGIRSVMHVSLTFDHRVIDGMYGCGFLNRMKFYLEQKPSL